MLQGSAPRRSRLQQLTLAAALGLSILGITQCRGVAGRVSGPDLRTPGTLSMRSGCARRCDDQFRAGLQAAHARHVNALRECNHDRACRKEEERAHLQRLMALLNNKRQCKRSCYNEGAGSGG